METEVRRQQEAITRKQWRIIRMLPRAGYIFPCLY